MKGRQLPNSHANTLKPNKPISPSSMPATRIRKSDKKSTGACQNPSDKTCPCYDHATSRAMRDCQTISTGDLFERDSDIAFAAAAANKNNFCLCVVDRLGGAH